MDIGTLAQWASIGVTVILALYTWHRHTQGTTKTDIAGLQTQINTHTTEINRVQAEMKSLPTKDAFHALELAVTEVKGGMRVLETEIKPIALAVQRIEKFLTEGAPRTRK